VSHGGEAPGGTMKNLGAAPRHRIQIYSRLALPTVVTIWQRTNFDKAGFEMMLWRNRIEEMLTEAVFKE